MVVPSRNLALNVQLLKSKVNRYAIAGVTISMASILIATVLSSYFQIGQIDPNSLLKVHMSNMGLWFLDAMPFAFAIWGQYTGTLLSYEAGAMIADQTQELRVQTEALEKKAMHGATHDALTGLPNRVLFRDRIHQALRNVKPGEQKLGVLLLDLDQFKEINDTMGHYNGDRLLKQVAKRLESLFRESDTLARLGGDEFGVLLHAINSTKDVEVITDKIHKALRPPFTVEELTLDVQVSIGAVVYPDHGKDVDTLIQRADIAMYAAKQEGKDAIVYAASMDRYSPRRLTLIGELRQAIENENLQLYYQPKMDLKTGRLHAAEVLLRWNHEDHGLMPPDEFIPIAERTGLIKPLTNCVLRKALQQCGAWCTKALDFSIAVNISVRNLLDPDFPDVVAGILASQPFPPEALMFEITETSIMSDPEYAMETINRISGMGIRFSIDDFGTGYSSLSYLKRLPISEIKIDRSFVMDMLDNESDLVIVRTTIDLAHNLGLKVVAEGVENPQTLKVLLTMGCDVAQGYYIGRPLSTKEFEAWQARMAKENKAVAS